MFLFFCTKIGVNEFLHPHQKLYSRLFTYFDVASATFLSLVVFVNNGHLTVNE